LEKAETAANKATLKKAEQYKNLIPLISKLEEKSHSYSTETAEAAQHSREALNDLIEGYNEAVDV